MNPLRRVPHSPHQTPASLSRPQPGADLPTVAPSPHLAITTGSLCLLAATILLAAPARADVILQTWALGAAGQTVGNNIDSSQYLGVRFQISQPYALTSVQIHALLYNTPGNGLLFAAILPLANLSDLPDAGDPNLIADDSPIEFHTFAPTSTSSVSTIPFSSVLPAGTYGLVFGSGEFGATGQGGAAFNSTGVATPSLFMRGQFTNGFINNNYGPNYFVVNATPAAVNSPEPASVALLTVGSGTLLSLGGLASRRRRA